MSQKCCHNGSGETNEVRCLIELFPHGGCRVLIPITQGLVPSPAELEPKGIARGQAVSGQQSAVSPGALSDKSNWYRSSLAEPAARLAVIIGLKLRELFIFAAAHRANPDNRALRLIADG